MNFSYFAKSDEKHVFSALNDYILFICRCMHENQRIINLFTKKYFIWTISFVYSGRLKTAEVLLKRGVDVNHQAEDDWTPLLIASQKGIFRPDLPSIFCIYQRTITEFRCDCRRENWNDRFAHQFWCGYKFETPLIRVNGITHFG